MFGRWSKPQVLELNPDAVAEQLKAGKIVLVDVREKSEWEAQHIPGAMLVPLSLLPLKAQEFPEGLPIVFHCRSGARSAQAIALMQKMGLPHNAHMRGGIMSWQGMGLPVEP